MSEIKIQPIPPDSGLVPVTRGEAHAWMLVTGKVITMEVDGQLYRVLEPWEKGEPRPSEAARR